MIDEVMDRDALIEKLAQADKKSKARVIILATAIGAIFAVVLFQEVFAKIIYSVKHEIPFNKVDYAKEQMELWRKNMECTTEPPNGITMSNGSRIDVNICESGDILLRFTPADGKGGFYRWVSLDSLSKAPW